MSSPSGRVRSLRGSAAMEFAIWLPVLLLLMSAVLDWGTYMSIRASVSRAAVDGARIGTTTYEQSTVAPGSQILPRAKARVTTLLTDAGLPCTGPPACVVTTTYCPAGVSGVCDCDSSGACTPPVDSLYVRVDYQWRPWFGLAFAPELITEEFVMAVENQRTPVAVPP